jgi:type IV pilus assembly protein PilM
MQLRRTYGLIGVDLGSHAIKLAQLERAASGLRLVNARTIVRPHREHDDESDTISGWEEVLAGERLDTQFVGQAAACTASAPSAELQLLAIPDGSRGQQRTMLEGELAAQLAGPLEDYAIDFWRISEASASGNAENVAAATLAVEEGERIAHALRSAGVVCKCIEPKPLAIARAQKLPDAGSNEPVAVLDWGYEQATLSIVVRGRPRFFRNLRDCGFKRFLNSLVQALELSQNDAQTLLSTVGLDGPLPADARLSPVREAIESMAVRPLQALVIELTKTLNYIGEHRPQLKSHELRLCGGGALVRNIASRLEDRLNRTVRSWRFDALAEVGLPSTQAPLFASALALSSLKWSDHEDL